MPIISHVTRMVAPLLCQSSLMLLAWWHHCYANHLSCYSHGGTTVMPIINYNLAQREDHPLSVTNAGKIVDEIAAVPFGKPHPLGR